jgi:hypothetical protein
MTRSCHHTTRQHLSVLCQRLINNLNIS